MSTEIQSERNVDNLDLRRGLRIVSAGLASNDSLERSAFILEKVIWWKSYSDNDIIPCFFNLAILLLEKPSPLVRWFVSHNFYTI